MSPETHTGSAPGVPWGILLSIIGTVATLWLSATGQLGLYIHPRYFVFTSIMAGIGLGAAILAYAIHSPDNAHHHSRKPRRLGAAAATLAAAFMLLVVPASTLSTSTVQQRNLNSSLDGGATLVGADPATFSLSDWAALISNPSTAPNYAGQETTLIGFLTPSPDRDPNTFYLARFVVTCCTVDAQPVGIPVSLPNWADHHKVDGWLKVTGTFVPSAATGQAALILKPETVQPTAQPAQPYDY